MARVAKRPKLRPAVAGAFLLGGLLALGAGAGPAQASCTEIAGAVACDGRRAHTEVGRTVIFPQGPVGRRVGGFVAVRPGALARPVVGEGGAEQPGPRPIGRPDRLTDPTRGRDFGAFEFPTGRSDLAGRPQ